MKASVIVVAYGQRDLTERCLASLEGLDVELVLVDNASPDSTAELFADWRNRARVVLLPENTNFAGGYNAGARMATGDVLVMLNSDTEVQPGAIERLVESAADEEIGAVGARLVYPGGAIQHAGWGWLGECGYHYFHHEPGNLPQAGAVYELEAVTGACLAIRRELFLELGGFDE